MHSNPQPTERRMKLPHLSGVWFGTHKSNGDILLRRHGKASHKDSISDITVKHNVPNSPLILHVHVHGHDEALVLEGGFTNLAKMVKGGRLLPEHAKRSGHKSIAPKGWDAVGYGITVSA